MQYHDVVLHLTEDGCFLVAIVQETEEPGAVVSVTDTAITEYSECVYIRRHLIILFHARTRACRVASEVRGGEGGIYNVSRYNVVSEVSKNRVFQLSSFSTKLSIEA